jgi:hypothetical protein
MMLHKNDSTIVVPRINIENAVVWNVTLFGYIITIISSHCFLFLYCLMYLYAARLLPVDILPVRNVIHWKNCDMTPESCNVTICGWCFAEHFAKVTMSTIELQLLNREINCLTCGVLFGTPEPTSGSEMTNRSCQKKS